MLKKAYFSFVLLSTTFSLTPAVQMTSSKDAQGATFPFRVGAHGLYLPDHRFFVAAAQAVPGNDFAISAADNGSAVMQGLTPATIMVNNVIKQPNPLHGAAISHLALMGPWPVVAKQDLPSVLFLIDDLRKSDDSRRQIFQSSPIRDGNGEVARSLFALETIAASVATPLEATATMAAFAAVGDTRKENEVSLALLFFNRFTPKATVAKNTNDASAGSGKEDVALKSGANSPDSKAEKKEKPASDQSSEAEDQAVTTASNFYGWDIVDALTGVHEFTQEGQPTGGGNKARLLTRQTPELIINGSLNRLSQLVDLHYDRDLGRLYIALQVIGGSGANDGARAVLVGSIKDGSLKFQEIAPASVFDSQTGIVGGRGANSAITIYKVRTLFTKTLLRYLVVVGGNGTDPGSSQQVRALPLVDNLDPKSAHVHGTLANVTSAPANLFSGESPYRFEARVFATPATKPNDIFADTDVAARVGGLGTLPGPITDIQVANDAIIVSVEKAGNSFEPGIFSSQPLYDPLGRISGWTNWQRVAGTSLAIAGFRYDPGLAVHWYISQATTVAGNSSQSVYRTQWTDSKDRFSYVIATEFPPALGGVQGVFDFPLTTGGFSQALGKRLSAIIYTGFEKVVIAQTGRDRADAVNNFYFGPVNDGQEPFFRSSDGSLAGFSNASTLILSGGALADIGPISSAAILSDGAHGWFAVAGSGGIAVLAAPDGSGWNSSASLSDQFVGLKSSLRWQIVRSIKNVRKLIGVGNKLFALSDKLLERIDISAAALAGGKIKAVTIARLTDEQLCQSSSYSDCIITGPLGFLATSFGLFRSGNGVDMSAVSSPEAAQWVQVLLPESAGTLSAQGPASRLFAVTPTLDESDLINGGTLYVLNGYVGLNQSQAYRFAIQSQGGMVTDATVQLFPDYFIKGRKTFFANPGEYRNYIVTDGALLAFSRSAYGRRFPFLDLVSGVRRRVLWFSVPEGHSMGKLIRNSSSGAWIASGDFGVRLLV